MIENLNMDYAQKVQRCHEYVEALEEERRKIQVFQRELPLCLELVTQAIEACRRELSGTTTEIMLGQSECSEQTMSECGPVLEEFIPVKKSSSSSNEDDEQESQKSENDKSDQTSEKNVDKKKSDWLRSVQLWNQSPDPPQKENESPKKEPAVVVKKNGGAFQPFNKEKPAIKISQQLPPAGRPNVSPASDSSSTAITSSGKRESDKESDQNQSLRKQRRCWSPELHRRFLHALQQLGGSHAATPKQIRELMKVDGLTNDEVKSHLQKYRLHTRRPSPNNVPNNNTQQQPQFMVVGGLWVPPPPAIPPTNHLRRPPAIQTPPESTLRRLQHHSNTLLHRQNVQNPGNQIGKGEETVAVAVAAHHQQHLHQHIQPQPPLFHRCFGQSLVPSCRHMGLLV